MVQFGNQFIVLLLSVLGKMPHHLNQVARLRPGINFLLHHGVDRIDLVCQIMISLLDHVQLQVIKLT